MQALKTEKAMAFIEWFFYETLPGQIKEAHASGPFELSNYCALN
ncbi:MAG: hypothetical protein ACPF9Q_07580 [Opitutales bacterium]